MDNAPPPTNRLTLFHMLVWMAVAGVLYGLHIQEIAVQRAANATSDWLLPGSSGFSNRQPYKEVLRAVIIPIESLAACYVLLLPWRRWQFRGGFPSQPGHWLGLAVGSAFLADKVAQISFRLLLKSLEETEVGYEWLAPSNLEVFENVLPAVYPAACALALAIGLTSDPAPPRWKTCFAILIGAMLLDCLGLWIMGGFGPATVWSFKFGCIALLTVGCLLASIATWQDRRLNSPRDLFHYAGIAILAAVTVDRFCGWLIGRLLYY